MSNLFHALCELIASGTLEAGQYVYPCGIELLYIGKPDQLPDVEYINCKGHIFLLD